LKKVRNKIWLILCILFLLAGCTPPTENEVSSVDINSESVDEYLPVKKTVTISNDKPQWTFVQRLVEPFDGKDEFFVGYGSAVIEVYEGNTGGKLIDSIKIDRLFPFVWGEFYITDVNFDGYKDIVAIVDQQGTQGMHTYICFVWNETLLKFEKSSFPDWGFISIDYDRQLLLASWRNWAASHGWAIYEYIDNVLMKTYECNRTYTGTFEKGEEIIHFVEEQLIDGGMQIIFDDNIAENELNEHLWYNDLWQLSNGSWRGVQDEIE